MTLEKIKPHPREVAQEILQNLLEFVGMLESLSKTSGNSLENPSFVNHFSRLIDGISTLTDGVAAVKKLFGIQSLDPIDPLETELLNILKQLLIAQESKNLREMRIILNDILPPHFVRWKQDGLPALIRSRDS